MDRLSCKKCGKGMYRVGVDIDPSSGLQTTEYQCYSLDTHHKFGFVEPIPGWEEFKKQRRNKESPNGKRMTDRERMKILIMLAQGIPYLQIAKATGFSTPIICRLKQITLLAAMGTAIKGMH